MKADFRITHSAAMSPRTEEGNDAPFAPVVSNHATLRYAERFLGIDLDEARRCILTPEVVAAISEHPTGVVETPYGRLIVSEGSVVAVVPANTPVPQKRLSLDAYRTPGLCQPTIEQQALLRYLEICEGVDVRAMHRAILSERVVQMIQFAQSGFVDTAAMRLVVVDSVVVTLYRRECADGSVRVVLRGSRKGGLRRSRESGARRPSAMNSPSDKRAFRQPRQTDAFFGVSL